MTFFPAVDAILKSLIAEANNREQDAILASITKRQLDARALARKKPPFVVRHIVAAARRAGVFRSCNCVRGPWPCVAVRLLSM